MYVNGDNATFSNSFGVEHIPIEIKTFIGNKNIITDIYKIQANVSTMCKSLLGYRNLFSPNEYEKNDKILKYI